MTAGQARGVLFDARSAASGRLTGWERYTRALASILMTSSEVIVRSTPGDAIATRIWQDWVAVPAVGRRYEVVHHPSFPPTPLSDLSRSIVTIHDLTWWRYPKLASRLGRHYYFPLMRRALGARALVTVSQAVADELRELCSHTPVHVVTNVVDIDRVVAVPARRDRPYLLTVGSIEPRKNLGRLATAFRRSGLGTTFDLVVVGRQAWDRTWDLSSDGLALTGAVSDGELRGLYEGAVAVVLPSLYEGFGLPAAEALAVGTTLYCSDIPAFREVAGPSAQYFDPLDEDALVDVLRSAALTSHDRVTANRFGRDQVEDQLRALYRSLGTEL